MSADADATPPDSAPPPSKADRPFTGDHRPGRSVLRASAAGEADIYVGVAEQREGFGRRRSILT